MTDDDILYMNHPPPQKKMSVCILSIFSGGVKFFSKGIFFCGFPYIQECDTEEDNDLANLSTPKIYFGFFCLLGHRYIQTLRCSKVFRIFFSIWSRSRI